MVTYVVAFRVEPENFPEFQGSSYIERIDVSLIEFGAKFSKLRVSSPYFDAAVRIRDVSFEFSCVAMNLSYFPLGAGNSDSETRRWGLCNKADFRCLKVSAELNDVYGLDL